MRTWITIGTVAVVACAAMAEGRKIRVPKDFPNIQTAINFADDGDTVIVSDGVWTGSGNKNLDFFGLAITVRSKNGPENCIIDCEKDGRGFIFQWHETEASVLDGFTITNGHVKGVSWAGSGGGIYCDNSNPTITNCFIVGNTATRWGGGIICAASNPTITNCIITGNKAGWEGGGIYTYFSDDMKVVNCSIIGNVAKNKGGGVEVGDSDGVQISNCILWGNKPEQIGREFGKPVVVFSDIQGGWPGRRNIDNNPRFIAGPLGDYYLSHKKSGQEKNSPCVNAGLGKGKELFSRKFTTRTDGKRDKRAVDMGFHWGR